MAGVNDVNQAFLDAEQYRTESILRYESVYGEDFVSPGGSVLAREMIAGLGLPPRARVLDIGCGLGGSAFVMAREFGLLADGIDLSKNMIDLALCKLAGYGLEDRVSLDRGDCLELDRPDRYDAVYSRDVFLHIHDKARLFAVIHASLRTGGKLLFTDYCCGPKPWSAAFSEYVSGRGYDLGTTGEYVALIEAAGFKDVDGEDISARFAILLEEELARTEELDIEPSAREALAQSWRQKRERTRNGDHRWGLFSAVK